MESLIPVMNVMALMSNGDRAVIKGTHMTKDDLYITVFLNDLVVAYFMTSDTVAIYMTAPSEKK